MKLWENFKGLFNKNLQSHNGEKKYAEKNNKKPVLNYSERPVKCIKILSEEESLHDIYKKLNSFDTTKLTNKEKAAWSKFIRLIKIAIENFEEASESKLHSKTATPHAEPKVQVATKKKTTKKASKKQKSKVFVEKTGAFNIPSKKLFDKPIKINNSKVKSIAKIKK